mgnify:CR=1 FL=1
MKKILIVEDEKIIRNELKTLLENSGYEVITIENFDNPKEDIIKSKADLVLLDINIPKVNGEILLKEIRKESNIPVIMVTSRVGEVDEVLSISYGADDYITKPFVNEELVARVKAHLRRKERLNESKENIITIGEIKLNKESFEVFKNDKLIPLSTKEFELLKYLMENAGIVLSKDQIYQSVWKNIYGDIGTVAVNIKSLRNKLDSDEKYIKTIWGMGYKFIKEK